MHKNYTYLGNPKNKINSVIREQGALVKRSYLGNQKDFKQLETSKFVAKLNQVINGNVNK